MIARQHPVAALAVAAAGLLAMGYVVAVDPERPGHYPGCPILAATGLYCPGCGGLRAVHALAHGDLGTALERNPVVVLAVPLLAVLCWRWVRGRPSPRLPRWAGWTAAGLVVAFGVLRNLPAFAWLAP